LASRHTRALAPAWACIKWENNEVSRFAMQRTRLNANIEFEEAAASRLELEFYYEGAG